MSNIEWTGETWNPVVGCRPVSAGCAHCYAARMAIRLEGMGTAGYTRTEAGLRIAENPPGKPSRFTGSVRTLPDALARPLGWRKPRTIFVCSMADLFYGDEADRAAAERAGIPFEPVPFDFIDRVFAVMALCPQHTFQVLTKRPGRMLEYLEWTDIHSRDIPRDRVDSVAIAMNEIEGKDPNHPRSTLMPLPNVWLGTSVENQATADARIPELLRCPAALRFLSCEPLLGPVDLTRLEAEPWGGPCGHKIDGIRKGYWDERWGFVNHSELHEQFGPLGWVIAGGESGPGARPCDVAWIRSIVEQCRAARVPVFVKQLGAKPYTDQRSSQWPRGWPQHVEVTLGEPTPAHERYTLNDRKGGNPDEWPEDLRVREMPGAPA